MPETKKIPTVTTWNAQAGQIEIYTFYRQGGDDCSDPDTLPHTIEAFVATTSGVQDGVLYEPGDLVLQMICHPETIDYYIDGDGNLIVTTSTGDTALYSLVEKGPVQKDLYYNYQPPVFPDGNFTDGTVIKEYKHRIKWNQDLTQIGADLDDFILKLSVAEIKTKLTPTQLADLTNDFRDMRACFLTENGQVPCWPQAVDVANDEGILYVRLSGTLSSTELNNVWLYWGNPAATLPAYSDPNSRNAVFADHGLYLDFTTDPSTGTMLNMADDTQDGTIVGSMSSDDLVDGIITKAWDFDGVNDKVNFDRSTVDSFTEGTWYVWGKGEGGLGGDFGSVQKNTPPNNRRQFVISLGANGNVNITQVDGFDNIVVIKSLGAGTIDYFEWNQITLVCNSSGYKVFVNGALLASGPQVFFWSGVFHPNDLVMRVSGKTDSLSSNANPFNGLMGAWGVENVPRSDEYVAATYTNDINVSEFGNFEFAESQAI